VQLGEAELDSKGKLKKGTKPKMSSLFPSMSAETLSLDEAVLLLSYPKKIGTHPEKGADIFVQDGPRSRATRNSSRSRSPTRSRS
jgi:DNA topoisomerase-1